jgi:hypothetical protein
MNLLITWLLGTAVVPTGTLFWATGGLTTAIILSVLLSATLLALVSQRERSGAVERGNAEAMLLPSHEDSRLPSAA